MGVLPLQFEEGQNYKSLALSGFEAFEIEGIATDLKPKKRITVTAISQDGSKKNFTVVCRIDTPNEVDYYKHGGILQYVLRSLVKQYQTTEDQTSPRPDSTQKYRILFNGEIDTGQKLREVKKRLAQLFKASPEQIEKLFTGKPVTLNRNLDYTAAQEYIAELKKTGALCYFEPMKVPPSSQMDNIIRKPQQPSVAKFGSSVPSQLSPPTSNKSITAAVPPSSNSKLYTARVYLLP